MSDQTALTGPENHPPAKHRLWIWFTVGFGTVFLLMALFWQMYVYDGRSLRQARLWQYYFLEIRLALNLSGFLGPTSGNASAALAVAATHVGIAAVSGGVNAVIGWVTRKKLLEVAPVLTVEN